MATPIWDSIWQLIQGWFLELYPACQRLIQHSACLRYGLMPHPANWHNRLVIPWLMLARSVATHLNHLITSNASELLGRHEVQQLLDHLAKDSPKLIEDLTPRLISLSAIQKVLQNLLIEGVHIRDMRTIVETLAEFGAQTQDPTELTAQVRIALGRAIVQQIFPTGNELSVMTLDSKLERLLMQTLQGAGADGASMEPGLADTMALQTESAAQHQQQLGLTPVLLVPGPLRLLLSRFLRRTLPQVKVLSHSELPENKTIRVTSLVGGQL